MHLPWMSHWNIFNTHEFLPAATDLQVAYLQNPPLVKNALFAGKSCLVCLTLCHCQQRSGRLQSLIISGGKAALENISFIVFSDA